MKYNVKHIDVPGFRLLGEIELPDNIVPFKVGYVVKTASGNINVYDSFDELEKLFFKNVYRIIEPDIIIIPETNSLLEYKINLRFYYLEKC